MTAILEHPTDTLLGLDFDGTLAPIVTDPEEAYADPDAVAALARLGQLIGRIVVITGRSAETTVRLGGFRDHESLKSMMVLGQYGVERWDAASDTFRLPPDPKVIALVEPELRRLLEQHDASDARVENKGRALAVHTRGLADPVGTLERLSEPLAEFSHRHGLMLEPGRAVLEMRAPGMDKGKALRDVVAEMDAGQVIFAGDDRGDLPAFQAVKQLRDQGTPGLLVCSASEEEDALADISDVVVDGPSGIATWLASLAEAITTPTSRGSRTRFPPH
jgi:trehalose 6-phosphate phosphatase